MVFGRKNGEVSEKDSTIRKFDARPEEVRAKPFGEPPHDDFAHDMADRIDQQVTDRLIAAVEETNHLVRVMLAERETTNKGLAAIKDLVRGLNYGEMIELASQLWGARPADADGAAALTESAIPATFHKWATS